MQERPGAEARSLEIKEASKRERDSEAAASQRSSPMLSSFDAVPFPPPPLTAPLTPPPPWPALPEEDSGQLLPPPPPPASSFSYSPSLLIIAGILAFVFLASASIHLLLRFLSRSRPSSTLPNRRSSLSIGRSARSSAAAAADSAISDEGKKALIESLPLFSLASSLAALPKSSPDCAVCLSRFSPDDELRLLPACCHAFHSSCIDTWLRSTPSCPLCRASIALPHPPLPPQAPAAGPAAADPARSGSFRIEIGSVSSRRTPAGADPAAGGDGPLPPHVRSYSLGSSFEYLVEEEVEAVIARIRRRPPEESGGAKEEKAEADLRGGGAPPAAAAPGAEVAEAAGERGRSWLREYVDRLASSASSSFSSLRFSGRWSHRFDDAGGGGGVAVGGGGGQEFWDLEGNEQRELEDSGFLTFYRWLVGA